MHLEVTRCDSKTGKPRHELGTCVPRWGLGWMLVQDRYVQICTVIFSFVSENKRVMAYP